MATPSKHTLLPKQPISKPSKHSRPSNPSARPADLQLKSTITAVGNRQHSESGGGKKQKGVQEDHKVVRREEEEEEEEREEVPVTEFDSSKAPQPFLDGEEVLEMMKTLGRA